MKAASASMQVPPIQTDTSADRLFWKRATNIFRDYSEFKWDEWYELWIFIKPCDGCESGFVRVMSTYNECKVIVGEVYNEQQFKKYITSL